MAGRGAQLARTKRLWRSHLFEIRAGDVGWDQPSLDWPDGPLDARKAVGHYADQGPFAHAHHTFELRS